MQNALLWTFNVNGVNEFPILSQTQIDAFLVKIATIQMYLFHIWYFVEISTFYPIIHGKELSYFLLFFLLSNRFISSTSESDKEQRNAMQCNTIRELSTLQLLDCWYSSLTFTHTAKTNPFNNSNRQISLHSKEFVIQKTYTQKKKKEKKQLHTSQQFMCCKTIYNVYLFSSFLFLQLLELGYFCLILPYLLLCL